MGVPFLLSVGSVGARGGSATNLLATLACLASAEGDDGLNESNI